MKMSLVCGGCDSTIELNRSSWYAWRKRHGTDSYRCARCQIESANKRRKWDKPSAKLLGELYTDKELSQSQIGKQLGLSSARVGQLMREYDIVCRSYAAASANMNNQRTIQFTNQQEQLILGSMLGDANLHRWTMTSNKKSKNTLTGYRLTFAHSIKQLDYLIHKREVLGGSRIGERRSGHGAIIKHFSFCHTPSLQPYAALCHDAVGKKQVSSAWLARLDWLAIAYWYMDDGSLIIFRNRNGNLRPQVEFHTESFTPSERELLREMLRSRFGLETSLRKCNDDVTQQKLVSTHKDEVGEFLLRLRPHIIPSMAYKIRWVDRPGTPPYHFQPTH